MKNLDKQQIIIVLLAVVVAGGFAAFRYTPIVRQKYAALQQMEAQDTVMQQVCTDSAQIPELKLQRDQLRDELVTFTQKVPKGRNFAQLWQQIADVMNACELSDQYVQPGHELKSDQLCSIPLKIECKGTLEQIFSFFQSLESVDRLIRIEEVRLENDAEFNAVVKLFAKASVYYQPDETDNG
jgi:Tfp pilus assembly protein PilO